MCLYRGRSYEWRLRAESTSPAPSPDAKCGQAAILSRNKGAHGYPELHAGKRFLGALERVGVHFRARRPVACMMSKPSASHQRPHRLPRSCTAISSLSSVSQSMPMAGPSILRPGASSALGGFSTNTFSGMGSTSPAARACSLRQRPTRTHRSWVLPPKWGKRARRIAVELRSNPSPPRTCCQCS